MLDVFKREGLSQIQLNVEEKRLETPLIKMTQKWSKTFEKEKKVVCYV